MSGTPAGPIRPPLTAAQGIIHGLVPLRGTSLRYSAAGALCSWLVGPYDAAGGWRKGPQGGSHGCEPVCRQGRTPCRQTPEPARVPEGRDIGVLFLLVTFLYSGHPALRPSGRLRRSHALLRMREHAKKSDPLSGRTAEARRRRATWRTTVVPQGFPSATGGHKPERDHTNSQITAASETKSPPHTETTSPSAM